MCPAGKRQSQDSNLGRLTPESAWFPHCTLCGCHHLIFISVSNLVGGQGRDEHPTLQVKETGPQSSVVSVGT